MVDDDAARTMRDLAARALSAFDLGRISADFAKIANDEERSNLIQKTAAALTERAWSVISRGDPALDPERFGAALGAALRARVALLPGPLPALPWQELASHDAVVQPILAEVKRDAYVLAYDVARSSIVCITGTRPHVVGTCEWGRCWRWTGARWEPDDHAPVAVPFGEAPLAFYDPSRGGVVVWGIGEFPVGILVDRSGARLISQSGAIPRARPMVMNFSLLFGYDAARGETLALGRNALWSLDAAGTWTKRAEIDEALTSKSWLGDRASASTSDGVLFAWREFPSGDLKLRRWDGATLAAVDAPSDWGLSGTVLFERGGELAALRRVGREQRIEVLGPAGPVVAGPPLPSDLPVIHTCRLARDPQRRQLVIGPGETTVSAVATVARGAFVVVDEPSNAVVGDTTRAPRRVWLAMPDGAREIPAESGRRPTFATAVVIGDTAYGVTTEGVVLRAHGETWEACSAPLPGQPPMAYGSDHRVIAVSTMPAATFALEPTGWRELVTPPPVSAYDAKWFSVCNANRISLVYDTHWRALLCFSKLGIAALVADAFVGLPVLKFQFDATTSIAVHDPRSGETLVVDLESRVVHRIEREHAIPVGMLAARASWIGSREDEPWSAEWVFDPPSRELRWCGTDPRAPERRLSLGPAFDYAAALGPRSALPYVQPRSLSPERLAAVTSVADAEAARWSAPEIARLTGISESMQTEALWVKLAALQLWRLRGRAELEALTGTPDDGEPHYVDRIVAQVARR